MNDAELRASVRAHVGQQHRFEHTLRVAELAETLARCHGVDPVKARLAAMLHDLARLYSAQRLIDECTQRGMPIDAFERAHPIVLHARLGAELARESFGVDDPEVLAAISKHTVADAEMSPLDCVVYLADALEPERDFHDRERLLALAKTNLPAAMAATISASMRYLAEQGAAVAPQTASAARAFGAVHEEEPICPN